MEETTLNKWFAFLFRWRRSRCYTLRCRLGTYLTYSKRDTRYNASHVYFVSKGATRLGFISFFVLFHHVTKSFGTYFNIRIKSFYSSFSANLWNSSTFLSNFKCFYRFCFTMLNRFILIFLSLCYWFNIVMVQSRFIVQSRFGSFLAFWG